VNVNTSVEGGEIASAGKGHELVATHHRVRVLHEHFENPELRGGQFHFPALYDAVCFAVFSETPAALIMLCRVFSPPPLSSLTDLLRTAFIRARSSLGLNGFGR